MKNALIFMLLCFFGLTFADNSLRVEVKDEQPNNGSMLGLRMRIVNESNTNYDNVHVKLFLEKQAQIKFEKLDSYMCGSSLSIDNNDEKYSIVSIDIPNVSDGMTPEQNGFSFGIYGSKWENIDKNLIFKDANPNDFSEALPYEVYVGESLIVSSLKHVTKKIRFVGIRPETVNSMSTWVQIQNYGSSNVSLNNVLIKDKSGKTYPLPSMSIAPLSTVRICNGEDVSCPDDVAKIAHIDLAFGNRGELVLYSGTNAVDYIAWGEKGSFADEINLNDREFNPNEFFKTSETVFAGPASAYQKGDFYRAVISEENNIIAWNKFRESMVNIPFDQYTFAEPFSLSNGTVLYKRPGEETVLAWIPVSGAETYELIVIKTTDKSLVYQGITDKTSMTVHLDEGEYQWIVNPHAGNAADEAYLGYTPWDPTFYGVLFPPEFFCFFNVQTLDGTETKTIRLDVEPLAARKDSYMLDLKWGEHIIESDWDKPHNSSGYVDQYGNRRFRDFNHMHYDTEESWRCWAVATAMINHYYGGSLTQDEIKYHAKENSYSNRVLYALPHDENGGGNPYSVLPWALNIDDNQLNYHVGFPTDSDVINALNNRTPLVVWENSHIMVIDAITYSVKNNEYVYRYVNIDNDGTVEWRRPKMNANNLSFAVPADPRNFGKTAKNSVLYDDLNGNHIMELSEIKDKDKDGILDFDEDNRFDSKADNPDSDGDGIPDKIEIMSYAIREPYPDILGVTNEFYADIDQDGMRAENDSNSDGDDKDDGEEDINHNGLRDPRETDVFVKDDDEQIESTNRYNITLYAISQLRYNDGVTCFNSRMKTGYCSVLAVGKKISSDDYSLFIGARANVGSVLSKGNVWLRSAAHVHENVIQANTAFINDNYLSNGVVIDGNVDHPSTAVWDMNFLRDNYDLDNYSTRGSQSLVVRDGQSGILTSGFYSSVKVEAGGLLYIPEGVAYIGSLQLDSRSKVMFTTPGRESVIHVNGDFTWRANLLNNASQYSYIAQGFKLVIHNRNENRIYMDRLPAANIIAPNSTIVLGQSHKVFYGTVYAENITVHQYTKLYHVDFAPISNNIFVYNF